MATPFDPLRAAREELAGLMDVRRALARRESADEEAMSKAEQELNATRKLIGFVRISLDAIRTRVAELEKLESENRA